VGKDWVPSKPGLAAFSGRIQRTRISAGTESWFCPEFFCVGITGVGSEAGFDFVAQQLGMPQQPSHFIFSDECCKHTVSTDADAGMVAKSIHACRRITIVENNCRTRIN
jgi:hypothetical protein